MGEKDKASFFSPIQIADGEKIVAAAVAALAREDPHLVDREQRRRQQKSSIEIKQRLIIQFFFVATSQ